MKRFYASTLVLMLTCVGCSGSPAEDEVCLGGQPSLKVENLAVSSGSSNYECLSSSGVSGRPIPLPIGGWFVESDVGACCTDIEVSRLVMLDPNGEVVWVQHHEFNSEEPNPRPPELFALLDDFFVQAEGRCDGGGSSCGHSMGLQGPLTGRRYDNTVRWTLSREDLDMPDDIRLMPGNGGDYLLIATGHESEGGNTSWKFRKIDAEGAVLDVWDLPAAGTPLIEPVADDSGFLLVLLQVTVEGSTTTRIVNAVHIGLDGAPGPVTEVFNWQFDNSEFQAEIAYKPLRHGAIVGTRQAARYSEDEEGFTDYLSYRDAFINTDGTVRWRHDVGWPDHVAFDIWHSNELADGSIEIVNSEQTAYKVIQPDGQSYSGSAIPTDNPLGDGREWFFGDCYFLDDGILILGSIKTDGLFLDVVAAMYEPGFASLRWARVYGESCAWGSNLVRSGDGWMLYCGHYMEWPECDNGLDNATGTYMRFDSICQ